MENLAKKKFIFLLANKNKFGIDGFFNEEIQFFKIFFLFLVKEMQKKTEFKETIPLYIHQEDDFFEDPCNLSRKIDLNINPHNHSSIYFLERLGENSKFQGCRVKNFLKRYGNSEKNFRLCILCEGDTVDYNEWGMRKSESMIFKGLIASDELLYPKKKGFSNNMKEEKIYKPGKNEDYFQFKNSDSIQNNLRQEIILKKKIVELI